MDDHTYEPVTSAESVLVLLARSRAGLPAGGRGMRPRHRRGRLGLAVERPAADVETGLLRAEDWAARPVGAPWAEDADSDDARAAAGAT